MNEKTLYVVFMTKDGLTTVATVETGQVTAYGAYESAWQWLVTLMRCRKLTSTRTLEGKVEFWGK